MTGSILDWRAESVHAVIFAQPVNQSVAELFKVAFGTAPDSSSENTNPQIGKVGNASANLPGALANSLTVQPGRLEIIRHSAGDGPDGFPAKFDDTLTAIEQMTASAINLARVVPNIGRVAIHCRLAHHFEAIEDANAKIASVLPIKYSIKGKRDFILQINEPAKVANVPINRILKWSVDAVQVLTGGTPFGIMGFGGGFPMSMKEFWGAIVHLDFNTVVPRTTSFTADEAVEALSAASSEIIKVRKNDLRL